MPAPPASWARHVEEFRVIRKRSIENPSRGIPLGVSFRFCGNKIGYGKRAIAEFLAGVGRIIFYVSIAALIVSRFTPGGFGFVLSLCLCTCTLLFIMRTKKR